MRIQRSRSGSTYANPTTLNTGTASQSWNEKFKITNVTISRRYASASGVNTYSCIYPYSHHLSGNSAQGSEQQTVTETGNITLVVNGPAATKNVSFAYFGGFVDVYPAASDHWFPAP